jgi:hypothetical protein
MPTPTWLPEGWKLQEETGAQASYGAHSAGESVSLSLTPTAEPLEQFRGATIVGTTTVQGRTAVWTHSTDQPDVQALVVQDGSWTLVVQDLNSHLGRDGVERIANSLTPFPLADRVVAPVLPKAWTGQVADVFGKEGKAAVTGWLVIDGSGNATICDSLTNDGTGCSGPTMTVDWATGSSTPPTDLEAHGHSRVSTRPITLSGTAKYDVFYVGV